ncbi:Digeranylgeranylglycerophospholipid reductase [uncultured archaeon]|nr:Digeranylgeranylglycerophospholipid reductase [uncultured archaeon]
MGQITIVGASLSGLSAASWLSNNGFRVKVFERGSGIGHFRGQDFQVIRNYGADKGFCDSLKDYKIDIKHKQPINKIIKYAPSGRTMEVVANGNPLFFVIKRGKSPLSLDSQIFNSINKNNLDLELNKTVNVLSGDIVATGPVLRNVFGVGYVFEGVDVNPEEIHLFMDNKYAPNGYIYVAPFGKDTLCIAAVSFDATFELKMLLDRFLEKNEVVQELITNYSKKETFSGYGYCNYPETAEIDGKLFVGAAAGFVEAARGFGVKYAILSGLLAAESILTGKSYDSLWKGSFGNELKDSLYRHFLLSELTDSQYERLLSEEKVSVKEYKKIPSGLADLYKSIRFSQELKNWQNQYSLHKLF